MYQKHQDETMWSKSENHKQTHPLYFLILAVLFSIALSPVNSFAAAFEVLNGDESGAGSLRQAVLDANANGNPGVVDTITFAAGVILIEQFDLDKGLATGPIPITQTVNISGPGRHALTIDGGYSWLSPGGAVNSGYPQDSGNTIVLDSDVLFDVGIRNADNSGISVSLSGFGLRHSGGLVRGRSGANVTVEDIIMVDNAFPVFNGAASCGMICTEDGRDLTITDVGITSTRWDSSSPLIFSGSNITSIDRLVMLSNSYNNFGGLWATKGLTEIINSDFSDDNVQHQFSGDLAYISNTVFRRPGSSFVSLIAVSGVDLHLNNVTIYGGVTDENAVVDQPSHLWLVGSTLHMANTVIAAGLHGDLPIQELVRLVDTTIALNSNNHVDDGSMPSATTGDAGLELLALGFKPKLDSILIDAGNDTYAVNPLGGAPLTEDILGAIRISGPSVDVGAVEVQENWAVNDAYTTEANTELNVAAPGVLINDQVLGALTPGDIIITLPPQHGTVDVAGLGGGFLYTPEPGFHGTDNFLYYFSTDGAEDSNVATVIIAVSPTTPPTLPVPTLSLAWLLALIILTLGVGIVVLRKTG